MKTNWIHSRAGLENIDTHGFLIKQGQKPGAGAEVCVGAVVRDGSDAFVPNQ